VRALAASLGGAADVEDLALTYGLSRPSHAAAGVRPLAVVKVGGEVVARDLPALVASLQTLLTAGLFPVLVHGGGPQLNDELAKAGVTPEYIGGHRVTDAATMAVAQRVFEAANGQLADALERAGVPVQRLLGGVFVAEVADARLGLVGEVRSVRRELVEQAIAAGRVPVLTSLGISAAGSALNINADVAARELAVALQPLKVVFISAGGGWKENGRVVANIDMSREFDGMASRDYTGRQGTLLKLKEVKLITDRLPAASSVTIASASALAAQLLPHRGPGTQIRRGQKVHRYDSAGACDRARLEALLSACGAQSAIALLGAQPGTAPAAPSAQLAAIFVSDDYSACAIVLRSPGSSPPLLHTMACLPLAIAEGLEPALWSALLDAFPALAWGASPTGSLEAALAEVEAKGPSAVPRAFPPLSASRSAKYATGGSIALQDGSGVAAMWYGAGPERGTSVVEAVRGTVPASSKPAQEIVATAAAAASAAVGPRDVRIGLLGARGFVGRELLRLVAQHPRFQISCASSRALVGKDVATGMGVPNASAACTSGLTFSDVGPDELMRGEHAPVDVWVLALPNGLAAAHVQAIDARAKETGRPAPLLIDLSADMRFEHSAPGGAWVYGLPERKGARERIARARRIANPGCYATGAQTALMPLLAGASVSLELDPNQKPHVFGVSGYSGAGTTPSDKNDPARLRDNLLPYALVGHLHEREISQHCGLHAGKAGSGVAFMPHVAPFFQGISLTTSAHLRPAGASRAAIKADDVQKAFEDYYRGERLVRILPAGAMPDVRSHELGDLAHGVTVGGFTFDAATGRVAIVSCIDNLLKGAATQAVQNMNLALGIEETKGILD